MPLVKKRVAPSPSTETDEPIKKCDDKASVILKAVSRSKRLIYSLQS